MLASMGISCRQRVVYPSVCPSVTSWSSTEMAKCRIMHATPHDSPGTLVFWCRKSRQNSNRVIPNGRAKCRWGRLNAGEVAENWLLSMWNKRWRGGSGISWTICKSFAPCSRQITTPVPHHSVFTARMPFPPPNQQRQSTEGKLVNS